MTVPEARTLRRREPAIRKPTVTAVIVSWNTRDLLARCLAALAADADEGRVEVCVVDNASDDGSAQLVRARFPWARLVALDENIGFGRAVNRGVEGTTTDWLLIANADVALRPGALDALLKAGRGDPGAGAIAPQLILSDGTIQHSAFAFPTVPFALALAIGLHQRWHALGDRLMLPGYWDSTRARRVPWAVAALLLVRRAAWEQSGGFDEDQWMFAEDLEFGWRLRDAGWATRHEPSAVVDHEGSASTSQLFGADLEPHWQRSTYGCIARRRGVRRAVAVATLNFLGSGARWGAHALLTPLNPQKHAWQRDLCARLARMHLEVLRERSTLERLS
jgi:N-acetylglucosaminyl-diphospho-decaprenol L-rhamnosyltransferase